jgi:hypothetical protein
MARAGSAVPFTAFKEYVASVWRFEGAVKMEWDGIRQHFRDEAGKYVAAALIAVLGVIGYGLWDWAKTNAEARLLVFMKESLVADPERYVQDGKSVERDANYARAIRDFQTSSITFATQLIDADPDYVDFPARTKKRDPEITRAIREFQQTVIKKMTDLISLDPEFLDQNHKVARNKEDLMYMRHFRESVNLMIDRDIKNFNGLLIGYVQTGTFDLDPASAGGLRPEGRKGSATQHSFDIFASNKSHIYLEFTIRDFDSDRYDIRLTFFDQAVCFEHKLEVGFNVVEFEVKDISKRGMDYIGRCQEETQYKAQRSESAAITESQSPAQSHLSSLRGHRDQVIPVALKILPADSTRSSNPISFDAAVRSSKPIVPQTSPDTSAGHSVKVDYIVVVSPLIEDTIRASQQRVPVDKK